MDNWIRQEGVGGEWAGVFPSEFFGFCFGCKIFKIGHAMEASVELVLVWESETLIGLYFQK